MISIQDKDPLQRMAAMLSQQVTCSLSAHLAKSIFVAVDSFRICERVGRSICSLCFTKVTFYTIHKALQSDRNLPLYTGLKPAKQ